MTASNPDQDDFDPAFDEAVDDFAYEEEALEEEGAFSEEEGWDENYEEGDETPADGPSKPAKKKGGLFNIILIAAAVLGGGGFIYFKVLSPAATPAPAMVAEAPPVPEPVQQVQTQTAPAAPVAVVPAPAETAEASPLLPTPDMNASVPASVTESAPAPIPAPVAETALQQPFEVSSAPPMPAPITAPDATVPAASDGFNAALPTAKDVMIASPQAVSVESVLALPPEGLSAEVLKGIEQKLSVLITRLDTFEGRITNLESGLHQMSSTVASVQSAPAPTVDLSAVNTAIQSLEKKMAEVEAVATAGADIQQAAPAEKPVFVPAPAAPVASKEVVTEAPEAKVPEAETPQTQSAPVAVAPKPTPAPAKAVVTWVLRSAQPGSAMVAPQSGGDMRSVKVGDTLSGLGRIVSIEMEGSRWVVRGTQGSLTH